jgi:hypothetical protein
VIEPYRRLTLEGARRMLSRLDRRPWSPTYGCLDREYWRYKTLLEFPRVVFQAPVLSLAVLYRTPFEGNDLAGNGEVLEWVRAALAFWFDARHADGSVDEWYLNERSFCATAYTTAAIVETLLVVRDQLSADVERAARQRVEPSVAWLAVNANPLVANQMAASLVALDGAHRLTGDARWRVAYERRRAELLALQHPEGWFSEYGGADPGYSLLTLDALAHVWLRAHDPALEAPLERLLAFCAVMLNPDGTAGGEQGSRATIHCFPYGIEALAAEGRGRAREVAGRMRGAVAAGRTPTPLTADDTYAAYFYLNSFCLAGVRGPVHVESATPRAAGTRHFPAAGLLVRETEVYRAVISTASGGAWRVWDRKGRLFSDAGFTARLAGDRAVSTLLPANLVARVDGVDDAVCRVDVAGRFGAVDTALPLRRHVVAFKAFTRWALRLPGVSRAFATALKRRKIVARRGSGLRFRRRLLLEPFRVVAEDALDIAAGTRIDRLHRVVGGAAPHSPSADLFAGVAALPGAHLEPIEAARRLTRERTFAVRTVLEL